MKRDKMRTRLQGGTPFFPNMLNNGKVEVCLKEDVDNVIAEKDAEIAQLQAMLEERNKQVGELKAERDRLAKDRAQAYDDLEKRAQLNIKQEESIRHHKYKRCVAMMKVCYNQRGIYLRDSYNWELENSEKAYLRKRRI